MITDTEIISNLIDIVGHSPKELSVSQPLGCVYGLWTAARSGLPVLHYLPEFA